MIYILFVSSGLLALDLLAINLKEQGSFVSRNLTFNGVHFGVIELSMDPAFKTLYDTSVKVVSFSTFI